MGCSEQRSLQCEVLDSHEAGFDQLKGSFGFMTWINRWLGGSSAILDFFGRRMIEKSCTVLDLGTGAGDIPLALVKWGEQNGKKIEVTAIDIHPAAIEYARKRNPHPNIRYIQHSASDLEQLGPFDYITASMFFHHLPDERIVELLQKMFQNARRGFVVNDLYRHPLAYAGVAMLSLLTFNPVVIHDAKLSVKRGFREADAFNYREWSGIDGMQIEQRPGFRILWSYRHQA